MNDEIQKAIRKIFPQEAARREAGLCPFCGVKAEMADFSSEIARKEYKISGMCAACQYRVFGS